MLLPNVKSSASCILATDVDVDVDVDVEEEA